MHLHSFRTFARILRAGWSAGLYAVYRVCGRRCCSQYLRHLQNPRINLLFCSRLFTYHREQLEAKEAESEISVQPAEDLAAGRHLRHLCPPTPDMHRVSQFFLSLFCVTRLCSAVL